MNNGGEKNISILGLPSFAKGKNDSPESVFKVVIAGEKEWLKSFRDNLPIDKKWINLFQDFYKNLGCFVYTTKCSNIRRTLPIIQFWEVNINNSNFREVVKQYFCDTLSFMLVLSTKKDLLEALFFAKTEIRRYFELGLRPKTVEIIFPLNQWSIFSNYFESTELIQYFLNEISLTINYLTGREILVNIHFDLNFLSFWYFWKKILANIQLELITSM
jgi:hypothetical protein